VAYFLAIDAGGTKTVGVLADETRVLARAMCGSVKLMRVGEAEATARLLGLLRELSGVAGVELKEVSRSCVGMAGLSIPAVREWAEKTLGGVVGGELELCGDEEIALDAAFRGGAGILVIAGTGSNIVGRVAVDESGDEETVAKYWVGGWGPVLGDEGSGYWIGVEGGGGGGSGGVGGGVLGSSDAVAGGDPGVLGAGVAGRAGGKGEWAAGAGLCGAGSGGDAVCG
jgi:glucosamine kinase